jgi:hypothetical protein
LGAQHISSKLIASYYYCRGGVSFYDIYCGIFCSRGDTTIFSTNWICGAALSFKTSTHYTVRGGNTTAGVYCGFSLVHFAVSPGITNWHVGAALSLEYTLYYSWWSFWPWCRLWRVFCWYHHCCFLYKLAYLCCSIICTVHIILFDVVLLALMSLVEYSLFILVVLLASVFGALVMLYYCTHYTLRGGYSITGAGCGAFCVFAGLAFSHASWSHGAALL